MAAGCWLLAGGPDRAECRRVNETSEPTLTLDVAALASLYLGGVPIARLASAGHVQGDAGLLHTADLMFNSRHEPWCSTEF
ncbi:MAG: sterol carrier protein domain-containing protein [Nocardiopsaceae bacterium]|nr:sterol carrier protein domain-containing protein [Nocardiopsaceae bacterium]